MASAHCNFTRESYVLGMTLPIVHSPAYDAQFPEGHRFPMSKYKLLADVLVRDGLATKDNFHVPAPAPINWVKLAHDTEYVDQVYGFDVPHHIQKLVGFEMTERAIVRAQCATTGTVMAARLALEAGIACNTAGGSHHANSQHGAGFCTFNDVGVAARLLLESGEISSALVFDTDVHQGDGTAEIFKDEPRVFTVSLHAENNYPHPKQISDLDVPLPDGMEDHAYLKTVTLTLEKLRNQIHPDIVFFNAGVDVHKDDRLGRLALTDFGIEQRERLVISHFRSRGIPVCGVIGGGYSKDIEALAQRHAILHRVATEFVF
ncbi:histone deacetylase [Ahrensia kielensis]|uniref:histone deacetylase n=1 Tax=Ahrensia kielensis TaxID=76980 RepID=UPI000366A149